MYESQLLDLCEKFNNQILANLMMGPKVLKFAKKKGAALDNYKQINHLKKQPINVYFSHTQKLSMLYHWKYTQPPNLP